MSGGLLQLVAYGVEDLILTGDPEISLFKLSFKRHTNFQKKQHTLKSSTSIQFGQRVTFPITSGDLIESIWLEITFPRLKVTNTAFAWSAYPACSILEWAEIRVDDTVIHRVTGEWIYIREMTHGEFGKRDGWNTMVGQVSSMTTFTDPKESYTCQLYLPFWDTPSSGLALASTNQNVFLEVKFKSIQHVLFQAEWDATNSAFDISNPTITNFQKNRLSVSAHVDVFYLDEFERQQFKSKDHFTWHRMINVDEHVSDLTYIQTDIVFPRPLVELIWTFESTSVIQPFNYCDTIDSVVNSSSFDTKPYFTNTGSVCSVLKTGEILLNDVVRIGKRNGKYFSHIQPLFHHTGIAKGIHSYSFALDPEDTTCPSGHCPASTLILNQELDFFNGTLTDTSYTLKIYKITLNRLNYSNGMCSLQYS